MAAHLIDDSIATMPRGGPDASWLDRRFETDALEYLDRDDVAEEVKQKVIGMLDRLGALTNQHEQFARTALDLVADVPNPRILELGAGHGRLSAKILELHPTATVTVSDVNATSVANIAAGDLGRHPRASAEVVDATAIDAEDDTYDLVVFALAFHHLPPVVAAQAIAEATRVARRFLVIDVKRRSPLATLLFPVMALPVQLALLPWSWIPPSLHDGFISALRAYSPAALRALGRAADPQMSIDFPVARKRSGMPSVTVVFSRP